MDHMASLLFFAQDSETAVLGPGKGTYEEYLERDIQTLAVLQARSKNCSVPWTMEA